MYLRPVVKIHGGKRYIAKWIISFFPKEYEKYTYVEPFCGAGSVCLNKLPSPLEVLNDRDASLTNILITVRDDVKGFLRDLKKITYSEEAFEKAKKGNSAINEYIRRRMSRGGLKRDFAWSERKRGGQPGDRNAWDTMIKVLPLISERLQGVKILNRNGLDIIEEYNSPDTLLYCDPPYLHETRTSNKSYEFEMTFNDHLELAVKLRDFKGKVILSGYPSNLYSEVFKGWRTEERKISNHASQKKIKPTMTEMLWLNY